MIRCRISLTFGPNVARSHFDGLFKSTCDAVLDAMERFPHACRISAKALP